MGEFDLSAPYRSARVHVNSAIIGQFFAESHDALACGALHLCPAKCIAPEINQRRTFGRPSNRNRTLLCTNRTVGVRRI